MNQTSWCFLRRFCNCFSISSCSRHCIDRQTEVIFLFFCNCCFERVWDQDWSHWHDIACAFKPCPLDISTNSRLKRDHLESSSSTTKTLYLNYYIAYGHQTWLGADLPWGAFTDKITWPFGQVVVGNCVKI